MIRRPPPSTGVKKVVLQRAVVKHNNYLEYPFIQKPFSSAEQYLTLAKARIRINMKASFLLSKKPVLQPLRCQQRRSQPRQLPSNRSLASSGSSPAGITLDGRWLGSDSFTQLNDRVDAAPLPLPSITSPVRICLVRHGQSTWNAEGKSKPFMRIIRSRQRVHVCTVWQSPAVL